MHSRRPPSLRHKSKRSRRKQGQTSNGEAESMAESGGNNSRSTTTATNKPSYKRFALLGFVLIVLGTLYKSLLSIVNKSTVAKNQQLRAGDGGAGVLLSDPQHHQASFERKLGRPVLNGGEQTEEKAVDKNNENGEQRVEAETAKE
eukprot:CAMPEP_0194036820 /NCGR_PEP_ID=MMETSP0009_2-20130614/9186_1 /TAXON_ID=210454 /ORGANISM="Grammatophora oceanica, Strain CCMP 410" /LENGTH=145 /DNA_ID=CAMNT_0038678737 /DNA_START=1 /DNA_END=438 /DNA_ORIENTATION=+